MGYNGDNVAYLRTRTEESIMGRFWMTIKILREDFTINDGV
ncbi:MAG: hypothetical protein XD44_1022 [Methanobacteriaceae archaeon 41_258]|nr:MAG: hypothetical protein XD44_1022 [Methanobacteriaceae archaeon 41_258]